MLIAVSLASIGVLAWIVYQLRSRVPANLDGRRVVVTGAGSGVGQALCIELAKHGAEVIMWDVTASGMKTTRSLILQSAKPVHDFIVDVTRREIVYQTAQQIAETIGDVDILINNAGIVFGKTILQSVDTEIERTMAVNATSHFWTIKAFLPAMVRKNQGHIVSVASILGFTGVNALSDYCASKYAAIGLHECLTQELYELQCHGVSSTAVCPYFITTGMFDNLSLPWFAHLIAGQPLTATRVAMRIVEAIRWREHTVVIPGRFKLLWLVRFLPASLVAWVQHHIGAGRAMHTVRPRDAQWSMGYPRS